MQATLLQPTAQGGIKSIPFDALPPDAWKQLLGTSYASEGDARDVIGLYEQVPWLYRAVELRADAVASMPIKWTRAGSDDELADEPRFDFHANWSNILNIIEGWLTLYGHAYLFKGVNGAGKVKELRPLHPDTIMPKIDAAKGLTGFERMIQGRRLPIALEEVVYFWRPSRRHEVGYGTAPAKAAMSAAGLMSQAMQFNDAYLKQGVIAPTLVTVDGSPTTSDMENLQSWVERVASSLRNAFRARILRAGIKVEQLQPVDMSKFGMDRMTDKQREEIATALGVPYSLLFSGAANYATANAEQFNFYDLTIVPECDLIAEALNAQLFEALGYELHFAEDELELYQDAETKRAQEKLVPLVVNGIIGTNEAREELGYEPRAEQQPPAPSVDEQPSASEVLERMLNERAPQQTEDTPQSKALALWRKVAKSRYSEGKRDKARQFEDAALSAYVKAYVSSGLEGAETVDDVDAVFTGAQSWVGYP